MQQPKVSVLISFYNLAPYVDQTMESVLAQKTDFPVEILCADDGSEDGTVELLRGWEKRYPDRVRVFVMDRIPGKKYEGNERIQRMNVGGFSMRQRGSMSAIWTAMTFIPMTASCRSRRIFWMQTLRTDMWPAATTAAITGRAPAGHSPSKSLSGSVR